MRESFRVWKKTGSVKNREVTFRRKNNTTFPCLITANNIYDKNGKLVGSNTIIKDITEICKAREKLRQKEKTISQQYTELKKLDGMKDEFLAMISHELRTPLVPIKGYVDILLSQKFGELNENQKQRLEIINTSSQCLLKLVQDLLDSQKIELGQLKLVLERNDLAKIINDAIEQAIPDATKHQIVITKELKDGIFTLCDAIRIEQVLTNTFTNAIKFCPQTDGRIHVRLSQENSHAKISIQDNGIGIKKNRLDQIFVKFYQIDSTTTREYGGTGLGLSVSKGIVESHNGKIWAESEGSDKGTTIQILLPLQN